MPNINLPRLPSEFDEFGGCVTVETTNASLVQWVRANSRERAVARFSDGGEPRWLVVTLEAWDDQTAHLHVETTRQKPRVPDEGLSKADDLVVLISSFVEKSSSESPVICSLVRLPVPRAEIPPYGTIGKLLGFTRKAYGASLSLNSARLDIDDDVFTKLAFNYLEEDEIVYVELRARTAVLFDSDYLVRLVALMQIGADCFVFERSSREVSSV